MIRCTMGRSTWNRNSKEDGRPRRVRSCSDGQKETACVSCGAAGAASDASDRAPSLSSSLSSFLRSSAPQTGVGFARSATSVAFGKLSSRSKSLPSATRLSTMLAVGATSETTSSSRSKDSSRINCPATPAAGSGQNFSMSSSSNNFTKASSTKDNIATVSNGSGSTNDSSSGSGNSKSSVGGRRFGVKVETDIAAATPALPSSMAMRRFSLSSDGRGTGAGTSPTSITPGTLSLNGVASYSKKNDESARSSGNPRDAESSSHCRNSSRTIRACAQGSLNALRENDRADGHYVCDGALTELRVAHSHTHEPAAAETEAAFMSNSPTTFSIAVRGADLTHTNLDYSDNNNRRSYNNNHNNNTTNNTKTNNNINNYNDDDDDDNINNNKRNACNVMTTVDRSTVDIRRVTANEPLQESVRPCEDSEESTAAGDDHSLSSPVGYDAPSVEQVDNAYDVREEEDVDEKCCDDRDGNVTRSNSSKIGVSKDRLCAPNATLLSSAAAATATEEIATETKQAARQEDGDLPCESVLAHASRASSNSPHGQHDDDDTPRCRSEQRALDTDCLSARGTRSRSSSMSSCSTTYSSCSHGSCCNSSCGSTTSSRSSCCASSGSLGGSAAGVLLSSASLNLSAAFYSSSSPMWSLSTSPPTTPTATSTMLPPRLSNPLRSRNLAFVLSPRMTDEECERAGAHDTARIQYSRDSDDEKDKDGDDNNDDSQSRARGTIEAGGVPGAENRSRAAGAMTIVTLQSDANYVCPPQQQQQSHRKCHSTCHRRSHQHRQHSDPHALRKAHPQFSRLRYTCNLASSEERHTFLTRYCVLLAQHMKPTTIVESLLPALLTAFECGEQHGVELAVPCEGNDDDTNELDKDRAPHTGAEGKHSPAADAASPTTRSNSNDCDSSNTSSGYCVVSALAHVLPDVMACMGELTVRRMQYFVGLLLQLCAQDAGGQAVRDVTRCMRRIAAMLPLLTLRRLFVPLVRSLWTSPWCVPRAIAAGVLGSVVERILALLTYSTYTAGEAMTKQTQQQRRRVPGTATATAIRMGRTNHNTSENVIATDDAEHGTSTCERKLTTRDVPDCHGGSKNDNDVDSNPTCSSQDETTVTSGSEETAQSCRAKAKWVHTRCQLIGEWFELYMQSSEDESVLVREAGVRGLGIWSRIVASMHKLHPHTTADRSPDRASFCEDNHTIHGSRNVDAYHTLTYDRVPLPLMCVCARDATSDVVRYTLVDEIVAHVAPHMGKLNTTRWLLPTFLTLCHDVSWRVRFTAAQQLARMAHRVAHAADLVEALRLLAADEESAVRAAVARQLGDFVTQLAASSSSFFLRSNTEKRENVGAAGGSMQSSADTKSSKNDSHKSGSSTDRLHSYRMRSETALQQCVELALRLGRDSDSLVRRSVTRSYTPFLLLASRRSTQVAIAACVKSLMQDSVLAVQMDMIESLQRMVAVLERQNVHHGWIHTSHRASKISNNTSSTNSDNNSNNTIDTREQDCSVRVCDRPKECQKQSQGSSCCHGAGAEQTGRVDGSGRHEKNSSERAIHSRDDADEEQQQNGKEHSVNVLSSLALASSHADDAGEETPSIDVPGDEVQRTHAERNTSQTIPVHEQSSSTTTSTAAATTTVRSAEYGSRTSIDCSSALGETQRACVDENVGMTTSSEAALQESTPPTPTTSPTHAQSRPRGEECADWVVSDTEGAPSRLRGRHHRHHSHSHRCSHRHCRRSSISCEDNTVESLGNNNSGNRNSSGTTNSNDSNSRSSSSCGCGGVAGGDSSGAHLGETARKKKSMRSSNSSSSSSSSGSSAASTHHPHQQHSQPHCQPSYSASTRASASSHESAKAQLRDRARLMISLILHHLTSLGLAHNWRVRIAVVHAVPHVCRVISESQFARTLAPVLRTLLRDPVSAVREATINSLGRIAAHYGPQLAAQLMSELLYVELSGAAQQASFVWRVMTIRCMQVLLPVVCGLGQHDLRRCQIIHISAECVQRYAGDGVSQVRLAVARGLPVWRACFPAASPHQQVYADAAERLKCDVDVDVMRAAVAALEKAGS